jgi:hypothetical protein
MQHQMTKNAACNLQYRVQNFSRFNATSNDNIMSVIYSSESKTLVALIQHQMTKMLSVIFSAESKTLVALIPHQMTKMLSVFFSAESKTLVACIK